MDAKLGELFGALRAGRVLTDRIREELRIPCGREEWLERYQGLVRELQGCAARTNSLLFTVLVPVEQDPACRDDAWYEECLDWVRDMYSEDYDSPALLKRFGDVLLPHFERRQDLDRLVFCLQFTAYGYLELSRLSDRRLGLRAVRLYERLLRMKEHFFEFSDPASRNAVFVAYSNLIRTVYTLGWMPFAREVAVWKDFTAFWARADVQACAEREPHLKQLAAYFDTDFRAYCALDYAECHEHGLKQFNRRFSPAAFAALRDISLQAFEEAEKEAGGAEHLSPEMFCNWQLLRYYDGQISAETCYDQVEEQQARYCGAPENSADVMEDPISSFFNPIRLMVRVLVMTNYTIGEKESRCLGFWQQMVRFGKETDIFSATLNNAMLNFCGSEHIMSCIHDKALREKFVLDFVVARHTVTFIHSTMVARAAEILTRALLRADPGFFAGMPGLPRPEDVTSHGGELLEYVYQAALFHDVGKNTIVDVINVEDRAITDDEFRAIRRHPAAGARYLSMISSFRIYRDVANGHHKSYDGRGGYPAEFDNVHSPVRPVINVITICDCLDAGTDFLGRSYHREKTLSQMIAEFRDGAGTRYDPVCVELLERDRQLRTELEHLLMVERADVYYSVYRHEFMGKKME